jgi:GGDEF domain-containing protein
MDEDQASAELRVDRLGVIRSVDGGGMRLGIRPATRLAELLPTGAAQPLLAFVGADWLTSARSMLLQDVPWVGVGLVDLTAERIIDEPLSFTTRVTISGLPSDDTVDTARAFSDGVVRWVRDQLDGTPRPRRLALGLLVVDVDGFRVYDELADEAGEALVRIADALAQTVGPSDRIFSGWRDAFVITSTEAATAPSAARLAVRLVGAVRALGIVRPDGLPLTVSVGVATSSLNTVREFMPLARAAVLLSHEAKLAGGGRARWEPWDDPGSPAEPPPDDGDPGGVPARPAPAGPTDAMSASAALPGDGVED